MPDVETDVGLMDETLTDFEYGENGEKNEYEREIENTSAHETEQQFDTPASAERDSALSVILEERGGRAEDWQFVDRGNAGYHFDGENIRDPDGNIWTNPDAELHAAMLQEWREGESSFFLLPDYVERTEDTETLYITTLFVDGASGTVGWEIHAHETPILKEEGSETKAEFERSAESYAVRWEELFDEASIADNDRETAVGTVIAAEKAVETGEGAELSDEGDVEFEMAPTIGGTTKRDVELATVLKNIFNAEPLESDLFDDGPAIEKKSSTKRLIDEASLPEFEKELPLHEMKPDTIWEALGIPLPSPFQPKNNLHKSLPGFRPPAGKKLRASTTQTRPGETQLKGIRMRRAL